MQWNWILIFTINYIYICACLSYVNVYNLEMIISSDEIYAHEN